MNPLPGFPQITLQCTSTQSLQFPSIERDPFGRKGHLSDRMMIPGNTWQTVWSSAKPVPARRQKRLFDDTKEAEKVLHFFESQTLGSIGQLTIAPLFHSALLRLQKEMEGVKQFMPNAKEMEEKLKLNCCTLSREKWNNAKSLSKKKWEMVTNDMSELELAVNQARSILMKLLPDKMGFSEEVSVLILFRNSIKRHSHAGQDIAQFPNEMLRHGAHRGGQK